MHWLECSLLVTLCAVYGIDSENQFEANINATNIATTKDNKINIQTPNVSSSLSISNGKTSSDAVVNLTETFLTKSQNLTNNSTELSDGQISLKANQKREILNRTIKDITPFFLFPILPFLFPPKEEKSPLSEQDKLLPQNESKLEGGVKPLILFDFAFNIRRIPLKNKRSNETKTVNGTETSKENEDLLKKSDSNRKRRNINSRMDPLGFFDDSPLFPDSELDEFLPKSDLLFPDLPFHHKLTKKLVRKKRNQKKPEMKSDLKMILDAFDEAFMKTKREVERTDPFMNMLRVAEQSFGDERKEPEDIFNPVADLQENPRVKWRIQRNIKRLKNDHLNNMEKAHESPMIIVDKVVKIGEFHMPNGENDKDKLKQNNKRNANEPKHVFLDGGNPDMFPNEESELVPKSILELIRQEESKKKRNHESFTKVQSKEIRVLPPLNSSVISINGSPEAEVKIRQTETDSQPMEGSNNAAKYGNLLKVINSVKSKIQMEMESPEEAVLMGERSKVKGYNEKVKKRSYDDLKKNVTELIEQFLALVKDFDDTQLMEKLEGREREDSGDFDWTEKETLQNSDTYLLRKNLRGRRQKKDAEIEKEFVDLGRKERQVSDINYLFLTVTLPTVFVFALVLLVCFFNLQIKGKICTKLFRPRQIFLVEEDTQSQFGFKNPTGVKKIQNI